MSSFVEALRVSLSGPLPGLDAQLRMAPRARNAPDLAAAPDALRPAAALLLIYRHDDAWHLPLTVRASGLRHHTGQVSLPGGRIDAGESVEQAALREAFEEVGVLPAAVDVLGRLTPLPIPVSHHLLHPVVGVTPSRPAFSVTSHEVDRLIELRLERLQQPNVVAWEERIRSREPQVVMDVPYFDVDNVHVWGATAMVLAEFLAVVAGLHDGRHPQVGD